MLGLNHIYHRAPDYGESSRVVLTEEEVYVDYVTRTLKNNVM